MGASYKEVAKMDYAVQMSIPNRTCPNGIAAFAPWRSASTD